MPLSSAERTQDQLPALGQAYRAWLYSVPEAGLVASWVIIDGWPDGGAGLVSGMGDSSMSRMSSRWQQAGRRLNASRGVA